jgi:hypothetical protein
MARWSDVQNSENDPACVIGVALAFAALLSAEPKARSYDGATLKVV